MIIYDLQNIFKAAYESFKSADSGINWHFIPAEARWLGRANERLIALNKNVLKKTLGKSYVNYQELSIIIVEVECILNNLPPTYSSDDTYSSTYSSTQRLIQVFDTRTGI